MTVARVLGAHKASEDGATAWAEESEENCWPYDHV